MANILQMMQKAQAFRAKMQELQDRVRDTSVTGSAGGGAVTCTVRGGRVVPGTLKFGAAAAGDPGMLEDLAAAAVNDALQKAEDLLRAETGKLVKDLGLPPGLGLPFQDGPCAS